MGGVLLFCFTLRQNMFHVADDYFGLRGSLAFVARRRGCGDCLSQLRRHKWGGREAGLGPGRLGEPLARPGGFSGEPLGRLPRSLRGAVCKSL